jgi:hypothetical protein
VVPLLLRLSGIDISLLIVDNDANIGDDNDSDIGPYIGDDDIGELPPLDDADGVPLTLPLVDPLPPRAYNAVR